jgi:hypothetical protein
VETVGWIWTDLHPGIDERDAKAAAKVLSDDRLARCSDLALVRDLADAEKHGGELGRSTVVAKGISGSRSPGGTSFTSSPLGTLQLTPESTLKIDLKDCSHRDMKEALTTVYKFLRTAVS